MIEWLIIGNIIIAFVVLIFYFSLSRGFMPWELLWEYIDNKWRDKVYENKRKME